MSLLAAAQILSLGESEVASSSVNDCNEWLGVMAVSPNLWRLWMCFVGSFEGSHQQYEQCRRLREAPWKDSFCSRMHTSCCILRYRPTTVVVDMHLRLWWKPRWAPCSLLMYWELNLRRWRLECKCPSVINHFIPSCVPSLHSWQTSLSISNLIGSCLSYSSGREREKLLGERVSGLCTSTDGVKSAVSQEGLPLLVPVISTPVCVVEMLWCVMRWLGIVICQYYSFVISQHTSARTASRISNNVVHDKQVVGSLVGFLRASSRSWDFRYWASFFPGSSVAVVSCVGGQSSSVDGDSISNPSCRMSSVFSFTHMTLYGHCLFSNRLLHPSVANVYAAKMKIEALPRYVSSPLLKIGAYLTWRSCWRLYLFQFSSKVLSD